MKPIHLAVVCLLVCSNLFSPVAAANPANATWQAKVDAWVLETAGQGETEFLVSLVEQADLSGAGGLATKQEMGAYVYQALVQTAARSQAPVMAELQRRGLEYRSLWVVNALWVRGSLADIGALASRPDVANLYANPQVQFNSPQLETQVESTVQNVERKIAQVNVTQVGA